jgi:hypothetical protein
MLQKTLILVKENFFVSANTLSLLKNNSNLIISFDYTSHNQLEKLGLKHTPFETFLNNSDFQKIDSVAFMIITNWYKNKQIENIIKINDVNLGWLLEQEFYSYMVNVLVNFITLMKIKKDIPDIENIFTTPNLLDFTKTIFPNCNVKQLKSHHKKSQIFNFDVYSIKYNLGPLPLVLRIPRKYFFKLRNFYENSFLPLFRKLFTKFKKNTLSVLLIDFNPARENYFLSQLCKHDKNIYLLNRRRVAIWNLKSFFSVRNTKSIPISYEQFLNSSDKKEIRILTEDLLEKFTALLENHKLFSNIFSIDGNSFWYCIKPYFKNFCCDRFTESIYEIIGIRKLLNVIQPSYILHFFGVALQEKIIVSEAKKQNIKIFMLQHGAVHIFYPEWNKFNFITGTLPILDEKLIVWGSIMKKYALSNGMKYDDVIDIGSIRHDSYFKKDVIQSEKNIILVALVPYFTLQSSDLSIKEFSKYEKTIITLCKILKKFNDKKIIFKFHPGDMDFNSIHLEPLIHEILPDAQLIVDADLTNLIPTAEIVITNGLSTFLLDSNIFKIPTVSLMSNHEEFIGGLSHGYSKSFEHVNFIEFEKYLHSVLNDITIRQENINNGQEFLNSYFSNLGTASNLLANKISDELI